LFVLLSLSFCHYIVCPFLVFPLTIILFVLWRKNDKKTNNIMTKVKRQKDKQYNDQRKNKKRTNNIKAKGKR
jgi:Na+/melibiose symporter-like transporter